MKLDIERWPPTPEGAQRLEELRREIDLDAVAIGFPRDDDGRLKLSSQVVLEPIPTLRAPPNGGPVFAILRGPRTRGEGERLELAMDDAIGVAPRWGSAPWLWRQGAATPKLDETGRAFVALVDRGRFDEALARYDIKISDKAIRVLEMAGASRHAGDDQYMLRRTLWHLAPWQLLRRGGGRLALLPHQTGQVKTWIVFHDRVIDLENTGSNSRLSDTEWKRPLQVDLERLGLERRPAAAAKKTKKETAKKPEPSLAELVAGKKLWKATRALEVAKRRAASEIRVELLAIARGQGTAEERANALWILGQVGTVEDGEALFTFLEDPHEQVCRMAIDGVKRTGYRAAIPTLARLVLGGGLRSMWSLTTMGSLSGTKGPSGLIGYLEHEDPRVREAACVGCKAFVKQGLKLATAPLEVRLADPDAAVAKAAANALGRPPTA